MHKEICEQPEAVRRHAQGPARPPVRHRPPRRHRALAEATSSPFAASRSSAAARRTTPGWSAPSSSRSLTRIPADAEAASEFRYRKPGHRGRHPVRGGQPVGRDFDTLAAVQEIKRKGGRVIGIVNTPGSTIGRACESGVYLHAGPEISVASTKTFTSTAVVFALLALISAASATWGRRTGRGSSERPRGAARSDRGDPRRGRPHRRGGQTPGDGVPDAFYIGRVRSYHVALEGAQKIKEISYIHAEAYPAAELKHGPLALVGEDTPTVVLAPGRRAVGQEHGIGRRDPRPAGPGRRSDRRHPPRTGSGRDRGPHERARAPADPARDDPPAPRLSRRLALGRDIDRPRNLAKSVTVE